MLASKNEYLDEASKTIFQLSTDEQIRKRCRDWEEYYQDIRNYERENEKLRKAIDETNAIISAKDAIISQTNAALAEKDSMIENLLSEISALKS